jgi:repressor LexA
MIHSLTDKQRKVFNFIKDYISEHWKSPTIREIWEKLGLSVWTIHSHISNLEKLGFLNNSWKDRWVNTSKVMRVPIFGKVACWVPIAIFNEIEEYIDFPLNWSYWNYFWLKAEGESMINAWIDSWDYLIIKEQSDINDGDIWVISTKEEEEYSKITLKRLFKTPKWMLLKPENDTFEAQIITSWSVKWKLVWIIKKSS